ncbi:MAG: 50S ribosomal protein L24 [Planctomycetes bacterium]|nr:50S ribosomal protein L24 [Planctomycetota bacterium]
MSRHFTLSRRGKEPKGVKHLTKLHVKTDDIVLILSGDDKGAKGKVMRTIPSEGMIVVEGVNKKFKHMARSQENPQGGRVEREYPIHACKVKKVEA